MFKKYLIIEIGIIDRTPLTRCSCNNVTYAKGKKIMCDWIKRVEAGELVDCVMFVRKKDNIVLNMVDTYGERVNAIK